jgi:hypothetical protein
MKKVVSSGLMGTSLFLRLTSVNAIFKFCDDKGAPNTAEEVRGSSTKMGSIVV